MSRRRAIANLRERMVLGQVRPLLEEHEQVTAWAHVSAPGDGRQGVVTLTRARCLVAWSASEESLSVVSWEELTAWRWDAPIAGAPGSAVISLQSHERTVEFSLPLSSKARARRATVLLEQVARHAPPSPADRVTRSDGAPGELQAEHRGLRGHARRIAITVVGVLVIVLSALFASPFVPGPGALTFLAGLAILAREYDWARDVHLWVKRRFERVWAWWRAKRQQRRDRRAAAGSDRDRTGLSEGAPSRQDAA